MKIRRFWAFALVLSLFAFPALANDIGGGLNNPAAAGSTGTVTSVTLTGDGVVLSSTPSAAVTTSGTLTASLATQTANTVLGALTATTPSGLALPSCSGASSALTWTSGSGFGCNVITAGAAAAGTLTGTTLASNVVNSSLTSAAGGAFGTGAYAAAYSLPTATSSVLGGVKPDGTTIANSSGVISCATGTTSQLGCLKPDGNTITVASGVISTSGVRTKLTSTTNFYVTTTGSDSNPCTIGSPCLTIGYALSFVQKNYDLGNQTVNINVADGTYTTPVVVSGPFVGGVPNLVGNTTTPANCVVSTTSNSAFTISNALLNIGGFKVTTATSGDGISENSNAIVTLNGPMNYGAVAGTMNNISKSQLYIYTNFTVSGGTTNQFLYCFACYYRFGTGSPTYTMTFSGSPTITDAIYVVQDQGQVYAAYGVAYSGSVTSNNKYKTYSSGLIDTNGACTSIPGTSTYNSGGGQCL